MGNLLFYVTPLTVGLVLVACSNADPGASTPNPPVDSGTPTKDAGNLVPQDSGADAAKPFVCDPPAAKGSRASLSHSRPSA